MHDGAQSDQTIHERLLSRDPTASEEIAAKYLESVRRHVRARAFAHGITDADVINDAAVDAVFDYIRHPEKFNPTKSRLNGYLNRAAERDLINAVRKDQRRRRGEELTDDVELTVFRGNKQSDIQRIKREADSRAISVWEGKPGLDTILNTIRNPMDRKLLEMMRVGERQTSAFAAVLGISRLSASEQKRVVKQHKDRLKQQLMRAGSKRRA